MSPKRVSRRVLATSINGRFMLGGLLQEQAIEILIRTKSLALHSLVNQEAFLRKRIFASDH